MPLGFLRKYLGNRMANEGLEKKVDDLTTKGTSESSTKIYNHYDVVNQLIKATYSTRQLNRRILTTSDIIELNQLGHEIIEENPMLANDIFLYTGDEAGKQEMKPRLFWSDKPEVVSYAYFFACEQGLETLKEFGNVLHERYTAVPYIAFAVGEKIGDAELAEKALKVIREQDPEQAKKLELRYNRFSKTKTPVPASDIERTYKPSLS